MNFSLTIGGVLVSVAGTLLMKFGFSESCSNEVVQLIPVLLGGVMAWVGRVRAGGVTPMGFKK